MASRPRPAPSAEDTASSRWRPIARTTSRLATFRQAIASTAATAASISRSEPRTWRVRSRSRGATRARTSRFESGNAVARRSDTAAIWAPASSGVVPGRRRATRCVSWSPRFARRSAGNAAGTRNVTGRAEPIASGVANPGGSTPTTRYGSRSRRIERPTIAGSAANRDRHRPSVRITTRSPPSLSSSGRNGRPSTGPVPTTEKNSTPTASPERASGTPAPLRSISAERHAASDSIAGTR